MRDLSVNNYKDRSYWLPAQNSYDVDCLNFIQEEDIVWCCGKDDGWTIFGQCEGPDIEEDNNTLLCCSSNSWHSTGRRGKDSKAWAQISRVQRLWSGFK